ncbi:hypothetical protein [Paludibaculum fermentans]|uniref:hypothetical protein n=1 Tax=Paludibaculum fermentans TaxID=1473598 RepID=UPI003EBB79B3
MRLLEYREQHAGCAPFLLVVANVGGVIVEFTFFPLEGGGKVCVMVRNIIDDPTSNVSYPIEDVKPLAWSHERTQAYREGFQHGWHCALAEQRKMSAPKAGWS